MVIGLQLSDQTLNSIVHLSQDNTTKHFMDLTLQILWRTNIAFTFYQFNIDSCVRPASLHHRRSPSPHVKRMESSRINTHELTIDIMPLLVLYINSC